MVKVTDVFVFEIDENNWWAELFSISDEDCESRLEIPPQITLNDNTDVDVIALRGYHMGLSSKKVEEIVISSIVQYIYDYSIVYFPNLKTITIRNPDCYISKDCGIANCTDNDITIIGFENSTAQEYAEEHNIKFKILEL